MNTITRKITTLRKAVAEATLLVSSADTIAAIQNGQVPKGNVFEFSRAAGLLGVKRTSDMIPDCHPLPIEYTAITHAISDLTITVTVEVHTIYKTGVEVEAMHGASVTALTMYDMLKPIDKGVEITGIRLLKKTGGKSDRKALQHSVKCAVVVCSDSIAAGEKTDLSGKAIIAKLEGWGIDTDFYQVVPDDAPTIERTALALKAANYRLAIFTGGTGLSPRDITPDTLSGLVDREIPGIMEAARSYGQLRTPYAMLSRGIAGFAGDMLVITVPGSLKGAEETIDALFPHVLHVFGIAGGEGH
ncbi:bifunctional molybdenum cofactor biosynthesis protein MoaC/MoaB [Hufsiella ginkgonis]|uniref:Bifunctional molybdenum cofactor biosynthesis protein MoaC/MoaB n=1 Tax=Hufsiella ginkgonis TaxID=2695274 RepID=A0A7K1XYI2_9SPHI|nr:bifunctional molybdenum cofactor biosynthesis protein MoaC/MoaB [Hufsiella ginkgonis]MXV16064.1 bifunctional molybdenum cofactor biosynthesis protein MoaC/MoaB [Hufsiella ginkgonis]